MKRMLYAAGVLALSVAMAFAGRVKADQDPYNFFNFGGRFFWFSPGNLVLSRSVYDNNPNNVTVGELLPPDCASTTAGCTGNGGDAAFDGTYPEVFNNAIIDPSFGITSRIFLDQLTPFGWRLDTLPVPAEELVTSFSSKSELALNLSTDGKYLTFMDYVAPIGELDASNANTPGDVDPTNPAGEPGVYRAVAQLDPSGNFQFTETNAYSGNNGRAAIYNHDGKEAGYYYTMGNAGNGSNPEPAGILLGAGAQILTPTSEAESKQTPGQPTPVASFNVDELVGGSKAKDKLGKDDNFRGLTIYNNVIYTTKGSGSNGVNTVYFVDTTGTACATNGTTTGSGIGVPVAGATLPTSPLTVPATLTTTGLPDNMCILAGFPSVPNKLQTTVTAFPFGIWFANANTLYVADEGNGNIGTVSASNAYADAQQQTTAGLQKWTYSSTAKTWSMQYVLTAGLGLGQPYTVPGYPKGNNSYNTATLFPAGLPWAPATDGLRNITGRVNPDGTVTIWAITSTVSGGGDEGADPNRLVMITDKLSASGPTPPADESFEILRTAQFAEVLRGISFTPGTGTPGTGATPQFPF